MSYPAIFVFVSQLLLCGEAAIDTFLSRKLGDSRRALPLCSNTVLHSSVDEDGVVVSRLFC